MKPKYNHAFTIAFSIDHDHPEGEGISPLEFTQALLRRIHDLNENDEWDEAVGAPYDTYENIEDIKELPWHEHITLESDDDD